MDSSDATSLIKDAINSGDLSNIQRAIDMFADKVTNSFNAASLIKDVINSGDLSNIQRAIDMFADKVTNSSDATSLIKDAINSGDLSNIQRAIDKFGGKVTSDEQMREYYVNQLVKIAIESKNQEVFDVIFSQFTDTISKSQICSSDVIITALKSGQVNILKPIAKQLLHNIENFAIAEELIDEAINFAIDVDSNVDSNVIKEIKKCIAPLLIKLKTLDNEIIAHFSEEEILNSKDSEGFPLAYYLIQKKAQNSTKESLQTVDFNKNMPQGHNINIKNHSNIHYKTDATQKTIMIITGADHNGAFDNLVIDAYFKKGYSVISQDHRNETNFCSNNNYYFEYYKNISQLSNDLPLVDILFLKLHGNVSKGAHSIKLDDNWCKSLRTSKYIKDLAESLNEKPIKIVLTSCKGQAALLDSIDVLPENSEMLTISEYRESDKGLIDINNDSGISRNYIKNLNQRSDLNAKDGIELDDIAILTIKGYSSQKPSPAYAKKGANGDIKMFSCIEKLEDLINGKIKISLVKNILPKFYDKFCGKDDIKCHDKAATTFKNTSDAIESIGMLKLGYKYHQEEMQEKLLERTGDDFTTNLAIGCHIGFSEINGAFEIE